ncbi:MAG: GDP-4-dehydro-6-deoxy-D-mannose reductase [Chloroflexota bacterium]|nr:GDP-4-dehydro-6-deoxy-D-mannose reductase [Chloroflexota bacterium]
MAARVLLTGITGFVGSHLAERLLADGHEVHGIAFEPPPHPNLAAIASDVRIHHAGLGDADGLRAAVADARPDSVVHLAGQAIPSLAQHDAGGTIQVNVVGTANLLAALDPLAGTRLVYASSADVYGVPNRLPVGEDAPLRPTNVYAASKAAAEALVREFGDRAGHPTIILRPANTNGPRQHPGLAASGFAKQIAEAEAGLAEPVIKHGRLDAQRDFADVRDIAAAYAAAIALAPDRTETYNVGTGEPVTIERILHTLVKLARIRMRTEVDPERVRGGDPSALALDASRFRSRTGWAPTISLERSLADTLDHWRSVTARAAVSAR